MKLILWLILISVLLVLGCGVVSRKLLYYPAPMDPGREERIAELGPGVTPFSLVVAENITLRGWMIQKDMKNLPVLFYFGGNAEEVSWNIEPYLAGVAANVILINYRGYGRSDGSPKEADLKADALKIFDRVARDYGLDTQNCGAWGRSLGSSIASHLAMERKLGRLILTCPFDSIEAVAASYYPAPLVRAALSDKHRTTDFSPEITASTLILAASEDEVIPAERTRALYDSLTCPKTYTVIQDTGHNTISEGPGYYEAVNRFLGDSF